MNLRYAARDVGTLLGCWAAVLLFLAVSTRRPTYQPYVHAGIDEAIFIGLLVVVWAGAIGSVRSQDIALGLPTAVCGTLLSWSVVRAVVFGSVDPTFGTALAAIGLCLVGCLCLREGCVIVQGRRRERTETATTTRSHPASIQRVATEPTATQPPTVTRSPTVRTRWRWWLVALLLIGSGFLVPI